MKSGREDCRSSLFGRIALIRAFEERLLELFAQGRISGTTHTCIGQEADAVGVIGNLRPEDWIFSNHRCHGHYIARFDDPEGLLREILGRKDGICAGVGGSQHLQRERFFSNGIQGGIVPCAAGLALGSRLGGEDSIAVAFLGDGTLGEGVVYETLNMASLWGIPLLLVVEDNGWAQSTPARVGVAGDVATRARSFGIDHLHLETTDVDALSEAAARAIDAVRSSRRPFWLSIRTFRAGPHSKGDDVRTESDIASRRLPDPLDAAGAKLDAEVRDRLVGQARDRVDACVRAVLEDR